MEEIQEKKPIKKEDKTETIVRILQTDIPGKRNIYAGLAKIKGVSFSMSSAICQKLKVDKRKRVQDLNEKEISIISEMVKNPQVPKFMVNRRADLDTGSDKHLITTELDLRKEFDIKRLKKIRSYRGSRHALGQPSRGQRTKSHFRKGGKNRVVGVRKK
ncbi:30S ribosomal protein S13 [Candidatus Pacearchaeota archaeon]|nr:30S ribosomal protein S13 [Candidatus Pacearchaeota archaeon]